MRISLETKSDVGGAVLRESVTYRYWVSYINIDNRIIFIIHFYSRIYIVDTVPNAFIIYFSFHQIIPQRCDLRFKNIYIMQIVVDASYSYTIISIVTTHTLSYMHIIRICRRLYVINIHNINTLKKIKNKFACTRLLCT